MQDSKTSVAATLPAVALLDPLYKLRKGSTLMGTTKSNNKGKISLSTQARNFLVCPHMLPFLAAKRWTNN